ncbi:PilW family protein [Rhodanobacter sp. C03]|uniref:PilW family protein n=1 Tax=Rhodanobacter sp. C03 TaxID=1945858 RepID=UPI0009D21F93|nr:PilW family protein [Rhodanobacter sp. C03]OOG57270.1 hypothetical protein B0E48_07350 [Rhodanobacter sp. C03]
MIELMIGILISLICTLAIMAAFAVFEGQKRTTSSGDDAQQNGSFSLYELERQIRTAGSGLVQGKSYGLWGCPINAVTAGTAQLPKAVAAPFAIWPATTRAMPVLIAKGGVDGSGNALPDVIGVVSGNPAGRVFKAIVSSTPDAVTVGVTNSYGIFAGDYLLGTRTDGSCAVGLATNTPTSPANSITLDANNSLGTGMTNATNVYDLGNAPVLSLFGVNTLTGSLVTYDLLQRPINGAAPGAIPIADGIVQIKALYGIHDGTSGIADQNYIDKWVQPVGVWAIGALTATPIAASNAVNQIQAVRVAVVAQSRLPERITDYKTGATSLTLFGDLPAALQYTITTQPQYRYKVYDTTIPVRNAMISKWF